MGRHQAQAMDVLGTCLNVRNETGITIAAGRAVYVSGFNNYPLVGLADNTSEGAHNVAGVTIAAIPDQSNGIICVTGEFDADTDTPGWPVGTELYLSTFGAMVSSEPTSGDVVHVGIVTVKDTRGRILRFSEREGSILATEIGRAHV